MKCLHDMRESAVKRCNPYQTAGTLKQKLHTYSRSPCASSTIMFRDMGSYGKKNGRVENHMSKKIETNPFYHGLLKDTKRRVRNAETEANRRDAQPNAQRELYKSREELSNLLSKLRANGYEV